MAPGGIIDRTTTLCLACSSSLPPLKSPTPSSSSFSAKGQDANALFITQCCQRPICPSCISSNPRLARYNPCLVCLGGVSAVASRATPSAYTPDYSSAKGKGTLESRSVRDEDTFILGDDDDDDDNEENNYQDRASPVDANPPPPYEEPSAGDIPTSAVSNTTPSSSSTQIEVSKPPIEHLLTTSSGAPSDPAAASDLDDRSAPSAPYKYYLNRSDTLTGICLRFGVDVRLRACNPARPG